MYLTIWHMLRQETLFCESMEAVITIKVLVVVSIFIPHKPVEVLDGTVMIVFAPVNPFP